MHTVWLAMRVVFRVHATRLLLTLLPLVSLLLFAWVQLDAVVNWSATSQQMMARPAWQVVAGSGVVLALWTVSVTRLVRRTLLSDSLNWLRRQPLSDRAFGAVSTGILAPIVLPIAVVSWVIYGVTLGPFLLWAAVLFAFVPAIAARRVQSSAFAIATGTAGLAAMHYAPILATVLAVVVFIGSQRAVGRAFRQPPLSPGVRSIGKWLPTVPLALVQRDLVGLTRTRPSVWLSAIFTAAFLGICMHFVGANAGLSPEGHTKVLIVMVAIAGFVGLGGLGEVVDALGPRFDPRAWPVSPGQRALATLIAAGVLIAPTWAAAAATVTVVSPLGHVRGLLMLGLTAAGVSAFVGAGRASNAGTYGWMLVVWAGCVWPGDVWGVAAGLVGLIATLQVATRTIRAARRARP